MIRNKLYDELEKEGYTFQKVGYEGQFMPEVFSLTDPDDWVSINTSVMINGQYQIERGPATTQKTVQLLQRVLDEISKPDYYDFISKACLKDDE